MKIVVISPESDEPREHAVMAVLFAAGLERYHVRKPQWPRERLAAWLDAVPARWRSRLVLHQHHELAPQSGVGGIHWRDGSFRGEGSGIAARPDAGGHPPRPSYTSCSCHDFGTLRGAFGHYDAAFFSPVFASISKPGYRPAVSHAELSAALRAKTDARRRTAIIALGGVTPENAALCLELGFDGVAVLGALWQASDPLEVFNRLQQPLAVHAT